MVPGRGLPKVKSSEGRFLVVGLGFPILSFKRSKFVFLPSSKARKLLQQRSLTEVSPSFAHSLTASQISKHQPAVNMFNLTFIILCFCLKNVHIKQSMWATRCFIHISARHESMVQSSVYKIQSLIKVLNRYFNKILNENFTVIFSNYHVFASFWI